MIAVASGLGVELPAIARGRARLPGRAAPPGGARRRARRDRRRRLRAPPDGDPRDGAGAQGPLRSRQADRRVRAALGHQPPQRLPERVRRRAVGRRRGGAGAALRAREGPGGASGSTSSGWPPTCGARTSRRALIPTVEATVDAPRRARRAGRHGAGDVVGRLRRPARQAAARARRSGDAGAPRAQGAHRQPARPRGHRAPGAGAVLAELPGDPGRGRRGAAGRLRRDRDGRRRRAAAHAGGRARAPRRGARLSCWSRPRPSARARRACATSTWSPTARRATSARSSGFQAIDRKDVVAVDRRRPPSTRWRVRRTRPGCARSCDVAARLLLRRAIRASARRIAPRSRARPGGSCWRGGGRAPRSASSPRTSTSSPSTTSAPRR